MDMPMPPPGSMNNDTMMNSSMDMHMSFYWGKDVIVFFSRWPQNNSGMYVLAVFFVLLLGAAIEVLSLLPPLKPHTKPIVGAFTQAGVYAIRMCFAYMVMLSVMSYNLGIFIAAVAGHAIGNFLVKFRALSNETPYQQDQYMPPSSIIPKI